MPQSPTAWPSRDASRELYLFLPMRFDVGGASFVALRVLALCAFGNPPLAQALGISVQLRKHGFQFVYVHVQDALKEPAAYFPKSAKGLLLG